MPFGHAQYINLTGGLAGPARAAPRQIPFGQKAARTRGAAPQKMPATCTLFAHLQKWRHSIGFWLSLDGPNVNTWPQKQKTASVKANPYRGSRARRKDVNGGFGKKDGCGTCMFFHRSEGPSPRPFGRADPIPVCSPACRGSGFWTHASKRACRARTIHAACRYGTLMPLVVTGRVFGCSARDLDLWPPDRYPYRFHIGIPKYASNGTEPFGGDRMCPSM